jgi:hypothetical protein
MCWPAARKELRKARILPVNEVSIQPFSERLLGAG